MHNGNVIVPVLRALDGPLSRPADTMIKMRKRVNASAIESDTSLSLDRSYWQWKRARP